MPAIVSSRLAQAARPQRKQRQVSRALALQTKNSNLDVVILYRTAGTPLFGERVDDSAIRDAWRELGYKPPTIADAERIGCAHGSDDSAGCSLETAA